MVTGQVSPPNGHHIGPQRLSSHPQHWYHQPQATGRRWWPLASLVDRAGHEVVAPRPYGAVRQQSALSTLITAASDALCAACASSAMAASV